MYNKKKNNKGVALVSTLIIVTLITLMSATLLQMSYMAYTRKMVERRTTETFYTVEAAIDTIKAAVQNSAAQSISDAKDGQENFAKSAFAKLFGLANTNGLNVGTIASETQKTALTAFLLEKITKDSSGNLKTDAPYYNGKTTTSIADGLKEENGGKFEILGDVIIEKTGIRIQKVHIKFVNSEGYVAEVTTDIVVTAPIYAIKENVPVGTYSLFAGNGASFNADSSSGYWGNAMNNGLYLHQEGNVYVGTYGDGSGTASDGTVLNGKVAMVISSPKAGASYMSVGGTNVVFNGDVIVENGNTLILTGGDGKNQANVQVNGYIYLDKGATLLMANNVNLMCKGIMKREVNETTYTEYTGASITRTSVSQFYPVTEAYASSNASTMYNAFKNNKVDAADVLKACGLSGGSNADPRAHSIAGVNESDNGKTTEKCAVYILSGASNATQGWLNRADQKYYLASKSGESWSVATGGVYKNNIKIRPDDPELNIELKTQYGKYIESTGTFTGTIKIDKKFADIINIQLLDFWKSYSNSNLAGKHYTGYDPEDSSTYEATKWKKEDFTAKITNAEVHKRISWPDIKTTSVMPIPLLGLREFRIPNTTAASDVLQAQDLSVTTKIDSVTTTYTPARLGVGAVNSSNSVLNVGAGQYVIFISETPIDVHVGGGNYYAGLFMSADVVRIGYSTGVTRGISLIEMAENTVSATGAPDHQTMNDPENRVRKVLGKLAGCSIPQAFSETWTNGKVKDGDASAAIALFDNLFNNGVQNFWSVTQPDVKPDTGSTSDNENTNFVDEENWTNK